MNERKSRFIDSVNDTSWARGFLQPRSFSRFDKALTSGNRDKWEILQRDCGYNGYSVTGAGSFA